MKPPCRIEPSVHEDDRAAKTSNLLNRLLLDLNVNRAVAMSEILRAEVDSRGGDAAVAAVAGISESKLPTVIGPEAMQALVDLHQLMLMAGLQLEFQTTSIDSPAASEATSDA